MIPTKTVISLHHKKRESEGEQFYLRACGRHCIRNWIQCDAKKITYKNEVFCSHSTSTVNLLQSESISNDIR